LNIAAPVAVPKSLTRKSRKVRGSINISDLDSQIEKQEEETAQSEETEVIAGEALHATSLNKAWKEYADIIRAERKFSFHSTLNNRVPAIVDDNTIGITLENEVQMEDLQTEKAALMGFIREKLNNPAIKLVAKIEEQEASVGLQTPREQFKHMVKKNPTLGEMTKRFDLDLDV